MNPDTGNNWLSGIEFEEIIANIATTIKELDGVAHTNFGVHYYDPLDFAILNIEFTTQPNVVNITPKQNINEGLNLPKHWTHKLSTDNFVLCIKDSVGFRSGTFYRIVDRSNVFIMLLDDRGFSHMLTYDEFLQNFTNIKDTQITEGLNLPKKKISNRWNPSNEIGISIKKYLNSFYEVDTMGEDDIPVAVERITSRQLPKQIVMQRLIRDFNISRFQAQTYFENWLMDRYMFGEELSEGLNLPRQIHSGVQQFGDITVFWERVPQDEITEKYGIYNPIKLHYLVNGEPIPESDTDPNYQERFNKLSQIFDTQIRPHFEKRGYDLWIY